MALTESRELAVCDKIVEELAISGTGLTFTPRLRFSFGFEDGELATLQIVVRPYDTSFETQERGNEKNDYEVEIGLLKMVSRTGTTNIRDYFNLMRMFADLYPIDREIEVGSGKVSVSEKRFFPMLNRGERKGDLDSIEETTVRYESRLILGFWEVVDE